MYLDYYALNTKPFKLSPDPSFIWMGERYREALAVLKYGLIDKKGFLLITGDVGTGKTTLINALLDEDTGDTIVANVPNPDLEPLDFLNFLAFAFGLGKIYRNKAAFLSAFSQFLNRCYATQKNVVLIVDEAHRLNHAQLEQIRLLSNIERQDAKLINIFFVGQNEFLDHITETQNRALRQRITINYHIDPLNQDEVGAYIHHRLKVAGAQRPIFSENAVESLYYHSRGYPRIINNIGDLALLTGYVKSSTMIHADIVAECAQDLLITPQPTIEVVSPVTAFEEVGSADLAPTAVARQGRSRRRGRKIALALIVCAALAGLYAPHSIKDWFAGHTLPSESGSEIQSPSPPATIDTSKDSTRHAPSQAKAVESAETPDLGRLANATTSETKVPSHQLDTATSNQPALSSTPPQVTGISAAVEVKPIRIRSTNDVENAFPKKVTIPFDYDSAALTSTQNGALEKFIGDLEQHPQARITIKGYTDARGNPWYNVRLSQLRADMVKKYLVSKGVLPERITTHALGAADPIASNDTFEGRQQNRRVELSVSP